jgi:hypothetical protein
MLNLAAAPLGPNIRPRLSFRAASIISFSYARSLRGSSIWFFGSVRDGCFAEGKLPWYGWHAFRRGLATNLHRLGVSDRVIQEVLRHANVTTTMNIYVKMVSADAVIAMKALEAICATTVQPEVLKKLVSDSSCRTVSLNARSS